MITPEKKSSIRNIARSHLTNMNPGDEFNQNVETLSTLLENNFAERKGEERQNLERGIDTLSRKFSREDGKFTGMSFQSGFAAFQEEDSANLQESDGITGYNTIRSSSVHYFSTVGRVYSGLFSPLFYRADASREGKHEIDLYEAVISQDRGNLKGGESVYEHIQGSLASGRIQEEFFATGDGNAITFSGTLKSIPLKPFDEQNDHVTVAQYTYNNGIDSATEVLIEIPSGALIDEGGSTRGTVNHNTGQINLNLDSAKVPEAGTDIVCSYSQQLMDTGNSLSISLKKRTKSISIDKYSVLVNVSFDGEMEFGRNPSISAYLNRIRENIVRSSVDVSGMDKLYRAGRARTVVWDKRPPAGISEDDHMRGLKYSVRQAIAYIAENADTDVEYTVRSVGSTKATMLLESVASSHGEAYRIVQPVLNSNGVKLSGYLSSGDAEHYCGKYLDLKKRVSSPVFPVQRENEILFAAIPKGEFAQIKPVAVMAIHNILKNDDPTSDNIKEITAYRSSAHVGFAVINPLLFSVLAIEGM